MNLAFHAALLVLLFLAAAYFAGTETALFSLSRMERRRVLEKFPQLGKLVNDLLTHPRRAIATLLIGNNIMHITAAAIVTLLALDFFGPAGVGPALIFFTVVLIFFGEFLPKIFAVRNNVWLAPLTAPFLQVFALVFFPFRRLVQGVSDWILGFLIPEVKESPQLISAQELKMLVKIGEEEGVINQEERRMMQKLFDLGERPVRSIMTPRTDLVALSLNDLWEKQVELMRRHHFSLFPVFQESIDQITGVILTQEVILSGEENLQKFVKPVVYIPELKRIDELLHDFQKTNDRFAVCVDEFGGTAGVVTLEDILEEIFGEFYDEYAQPEQPIRELGMGQYLVEAKISLAQFNEFFQSRLRSKEAGTLSGFILEKLGRVPRKNDVLDLPNFHFRIHDMARQRIVKVVVAPKR